MNALRVVLAADEAAGRRTMQLIERSPHTLVAVASVPGGDLATRACAAGVMTLDSRSLGCADTAKQLTSLQPDVLLNVHSLTKVCDAVIEVFEVGAWNLHPGPLPEAAGINVPSWAVALGWTDHGVSLHWMTSDYDAGDLAYEDRFSVSPTATGLTLSAECGSRGVRLVSKLIDQLCDDPTAVPRLPQDAARRRYFGRGQPNDGNIDWTQIADSIDAHVRAADFRPFSSPWTPPRAELDGELYEFVEVQLGDVATAPPGTQMNSPTGLAIAAADRWVNVIDARKVPQ